MEIVYNLLCKELPETQIYLINARFIKPLDEKFLHSIENEVKHIFTLEDNSLIGGFGSSIKDIFVNTDVDVHSFGIPDHFVTHGNTDDLKKKIRIKPDQISKSIKKILSSK